MIKEAMLWRKMDGNRVHCFLCAHQCRINESKFGICGVRQNIKGELKTMAFGDIIAANVDPIEKKPLYHFLPGSQSFSIATIGCNFKCGFCQNWQISQVNFKDGGSRPAREVSPEQVVRLAAQSQCSSISYTYTEPTIFFEYAFETAQAANRDRIKNVFVTNGFMTREALETVRPFLQAANVDLKSFNNEMYKKACRARLHPVLDTIKAMKELGVWIEVTTLIIPGENDSDKELKELAGFLSGVDVNIPWHISRFHPDYKFTDHAATPLETLKKAREIGRESGLRYIYLGNVAEGGNTYCYQCGTLVVERRYMGLNRINLKEGRCPNCGVSIEGVWS